MNPIREHWNDVWSTKPHETVSWYQDDPRVSMSVVERLGIAAGDEVIDVGCGASHLADRLVARGVRRLHLIDISAAALDQVRSRLDSIESATEVRYHPADVLELDPVPSVSLWHDRAVLHFLDDARGRERYAAIAAKAVRPGGHLVVGGFAPDGPKRCSDLDVRRAGADELADLFSPGFRPVSSEQELHETPWGAAQSFQWCVFQRTG
ncbi:MAG: SAM-dependent methyltransferase [Planctomycetaceae bacterium]|nr:SAM-dependent methyltransferase [Planctomycetaceae bacterium]